MARRRKQKKYDEILSAHIDSLSHDGRGVGRIDGKTVFVEGALPGEDVTFRLTRRKQTFDEGTVVDVQTPCADRVEPRCAFFGTCGGCSLQHLDDTVQIQYKQQILIDNLKRLGDVSPEEILPPLIGPHWQYRHKARLGVRFVKKKNAVLVGFREKGSSFLMDMDRCEVLHARVGTRIDALRDMLAEISIRDKIAQIEVAIGDDTVALVFRNLEPLSEEDTARLVRFGRDYDFQVYIQPKGPDSIVLLWPEQASLSYRLSEFDVEFAFLPTDFTQVNVEINQKMVSLALSLLDPQVDDHVLDLFCGLGNFTLPIARRAGDVVGVEGDDALVLRAGENARRNNLGNVQFHRADLTSELVEAPWFRAGGYNKILIDPPRSGALEMMPFLPKFGAQRVVYVSCNPATLARDAGELVNNHGYVLKKAGVMDMFPHTTHVESIALFAL